MEIVRATDSFRTEGTDPASDAGFERFLTSVLSASQVRETVDHARATQTTLTDAVAALGFMTETRAYEALAEWAGLAYVNLEVAPPSPEASRLVPERLARTHQIIPIAQDNRTLTYAASTPLDADVDREVAFASGRRPQLVIASRSQVILALNKAYAQGADIEVDLCNRILGGAILAGANDVLLEPSADGAVVSHRVGGVLEPLMVLPSTAVSRVTNRFKLMGKTDIATRFKPQDGAFRVAIDGTAIDVRLSVLPTIHGEKLVMRVTHVASGSQSLAAEGANEPVSVAASGKVVADKVGSPRPIPGRRILVTDDDKMIRLLVRLLLQKEGFEVLEAENGAIGIEVAQREHPDLMLVDLQMPDVNGFEAIEAIRRDLTMSSMPILVLTADTSPQLESKVLSIGANDYLVKPFEPEVLIARVRAAFRRSRQSVAA